MTSRRLGLFAAACLGQVAVASAQPLVDAAGTVPGLRVEMRYAGTNNFVGRIVEGYEAPRCLLTQNAAKALRLIQKRLSSKGVGLKVFDCYRPERAVRDFVRWAADPNDQIGKAAFYPDIDKRDLFRLGYIAARSAHSRGSTVDLTLVRLADGSEIDMGTAFDTFGPASAPASPDVTPAQRANRDRLRSAMIRAGFTPYAQEWWHFTLAREPYPATSFDVPIR